MLYRLLEEDAAVTARQMSSLQTIGYGSAPIPPDRLDLLLGRYGPRFIQLYGMAEVTAIATLLRKADHVQALSSKPQLLKSCGRPSYLLDVRVSDDGGREAGSHERGEIVMAGSHVMLEYFREPERTAETLKDGWIHSGDIGFADDEGYFYLVDRKKDLIIRGGYNITPSEIEAVVYTHPAVLEAAVVGVPDKEWGEAILAVVALKPGASATAAEILDFCRTSVLPNFKRPERVEIVESLPKNATGKISKKEIREARWEGARKV
jgi:acyl-CoA synthetase (AMP-forming)/AMP-acid ligase II